ncbi:MAG: cell wall hydrolase [Sphingobium sp.]|nr:cell wall hydrolase [Sphingobium sp.]MCP5399292.1 cell wall hydrolase [Sphingomonas sp.]
MPLVEPKHSAARFDWPAAVAAALLLLIPLLGTEFADIGSTGGKEGSSIAASYGRTPPPVEPMAVRALSPDEARAHNASIPFSNAPKPAARPFHFASAGNDLDRAIDCLAAAQYYEAGDDPAGQKAVAQVVLNRVRHPAFPKSVCGVVFQGAERTTGCQFTFTCDGSMAHTPPAPAWDRSRALARRMLSGLVDREVGYATHYHTDWVVPYWSSSLDKIGEVHTHLFFRWQGWWGTPRAFLRSVHEAEPKIISLARLSPFHDPLSGDDADSGMRAPQMTVNATDLAEAPKGYSIDTAHPSGSAGGASVIATSAEKDAFILSLPNDMATSDYLSAARTFCSGRTKCRIMGWRANAPPPGGFPVPSKALSSMQFSYIHDASSNLQRLLWNCDMVPQDNPRNCMRERMPVTDIPPPGKTTARP